jgi:hypothetical protein
MKRATTRICRRVIWRKEHTAYHTTPVDLRRVREKRAFTTQVRNNRDPKVRGKEKRVRGSWQK